MCWGDVQLRQTTNGEEFLEYTEKQTKTRTGENPRDVRQIKPKMFSVQGSERDTVAVYKFYAEKRPSEMNDKNAPFYLAVNSCKKQDSSKPWFKTSAVGVNKLNPLMKKMAEKAGLGPNVKNHSGRKTMIQTLTNNDIPATYIIQLSGHKNLQSVTNYSVVSEKQQVKMSRTLSELMSGNVHSLEKTNSSQVGECSTEIPSASSAAEHHQQAMSLFTAVIIHGGQFIYLINQARGPYWENIGPRSWQYGPNAARSVQKRPRADVLPVRSRASLVNKRFITRLKKALKVFHKLRFPSWLHISLVLGVSIAGAGSPSFVVLLKVSNSRMKQGFSKSAIHSGVLRRNFRKISSSSAILNFKFKGTQVVRDHSGQCPVQYLENIGPAIEHFDWLILVIGPLTAWVV